MIRHFRKQFIIFSTCALLLVIVTIVGSISSITYFRAHQEVNSVLQILSNNEGEMPARTVYSQPQLFSQSQFTKESLYQYRYLSTYYNKKNMHMHIEDYQLL